ncbi:MAG TPA: phosphate acyltransferase, partial [Burkholderiaceae bacterium]|nr:phosphate acyltransferase [Burkholderiaceae bacterium]
MTRIAVDCMGGDHGCAVTVPASLAFLNHHADAQLLLVGRRAEIEAALKGARPDRIEVLHADDVVEMGDAPAIALRSKRNSSMRVAINQVKEDRADVCVSAGNTGALMAIARFVLKTLE